MILKPSCTLVSIYDDNSGKDHVLFHSAHGALWMSWAETEIYLLSVSLLCKYPALALKNFNRPEHKACAWMSGEEWSFNYEG